MKRQADLWKAAGQPASTLAEFQSSSAGPGRGAVCVLFQTKWKAGSEKARRAEALAASAGLNGKCPSQAPGFEHLIPSWGYCVRMLQNLLWV